MTKTLGRPKMMNGVLLSFLLGTVGALMIFLPFVIVDKGFFLNCGDYNSQQIPFYVYLNQFIKDGGGTWSWATDLGSSAISSYSFYNLGSPFFWLSLLFPSRWLPYMMVPLFMIKFGAIAASCCLFLQRYAKTRNMAVICSVIYAFCSFNIYNTFFNHMLEPVVIFPLMLWALDGFVLDGKRGWFALTVGLALVNSYFFFAGNAVFILIYFLVKLAVGEYTITPARFFSLALEVLIGCGIGMVLALPSFLTLLQNPRTGDFADGFGLIMYSRVQQYFAILTSPFLPPDPTYRPNLYTDAIIKHTSMTALLPIVSVAGVAAYWKSRKRDGAKWILGLCILAAFVPILNSAFYAFNRSYYARWYYMPLLIAVFMTLQALEEADIDLKFGAKFAVITTACFGILGLLPTKGEDGAWKLGVQQETGRFWLTFLTAVVGVVIFFVIVRFFKKTPRFAPILLAAVMGFSVFYSVVHIALGKFPQWERDADYKAQQYDSTQDIQLEGDGFFRIDTYNAHDNLALWLNQSGLQTFNSTVNPSIMEFYPNLGVTRDVSSKPETKFFGLRGLLSVRYTLVPLNEVSNFESEVPGSRGWTREQDQGAFAVYENENYLPFGFCYDSYILMDDLLAAYEEDRSALLVRAVGLSEDQALEYGHLFTGVVGSAAYQPASYENYVQDVENRRTEASYAVTYDSSGFTANIQMQKPNLVFFSVPYDEGFIATVNGAETEVLKVSGGMSAVYAPAGDNEIVFTYKTPGFRTGALISLVSLAALALYLLAARQLAKRPPRPAKIRAAALPPGNVYTKERRHAFDFDKAEIQPQNETPGETEVERAAASTDDSRMVDESPPAQDPPGQNPDTGEA